MSIAITSRHGSAHITPAQDSMWHRAIFGLDTCVIADDKTLNFEADIQSNNEVRVRSGIALDGINLTAITPIFKTAISTEAARISAETKQMFAAAGYPITD